MSTGEVLRVRAAMKPISTVPRALRTVDVATGEAAVAHHQRSDVCAVPAAGVVAEAMVALVLADAVLEKFGGDAVPETRRNVESYLDHRLTIREGPMTAPRVVLVGPMGAGKSTVGRLLAERWGVPFRDTDDDVEQAEGRTDLRHLRGVRRGALPGRSRRAAVARALAEHDGVLALGGGAVMAGRQPGRAGRAPGRLPAGRARGRRGPGRAGGLAPAAAGQRARHDEGAARRAHSGLRVGGGRGRRHRRTDARRGRARWSRRRSVADPTVIRVETAAAYDVVVGGDLLGRLPELLG